MWYLFYLLSVFKNTFPSSTVLLFQLYLILLIAIIVVFILGGDGKARPTMPQFDIALVSEKLSGHIVQMKQPEVINSQSVKLNWEVSCPFTSKAHCQTMCALM